MKHDIAKKALVPAVGLATLLAASGTACPPTGSATLLDAGARFRGCAASPIHDGRVPAGSGAAPVGIPWIRAAPASSRIFAVLFFSRRAGDGTHTLLHSRGWMPNGSTTKVLWVEDNSRAAGATTIRGTNLTGAGHVVLRWQENPRASGHEMYPSIVNVPTPGCWLFAIKAGRVTASVVMTAVRGGWAAAASMPQGRIGQTATTIGNGLVLVVGGYGCGGGSPSDACSTAQIFDPSSNTWRAAGSLPPGPVGQTATLLPGGNVVLVAGGTLGRKAERYDLAAGKWLPAGEMVSTACYETATLLSSGEALLAGGYRCVGLSKRPTASAQVYDPSTNRWAAVGSMREARFLDSATLLRNGEVLVTGGEGCGAQHICATSELYDPRSQKWSTTGRMQVPREQPTATLLSNGKVLVSGGYGCLPSGVCASAELYNPATGRWRYTGSMHVARAGHTATLLPDGDVVVVGGYGCTVRACGPVASVEVYNPRSGAWRTEAPIPARREYQTATPLTDGRVLVAGGSAGCTYPAGCTPESGVEFYIPGAQTAATATDAPAARRSGSAAALECRTTPIHTGPFPEPGYSDTPWVRVGPKSAPISGFLFYGDRLLRTDGQMPGGGIGKLGWFDATGGTSIRITGTDLTGPERGRTIPLSNGTPVLPRPGCWRFDLSAGHIRAHATFLVLGD